MTPALSGVCGGRPQHPPPLARVCSSVFVPAGCVSPGSVKSPHAPAFQLLNNTKQTLTYFQSREQARQKTRSGAHAGAGARRRRRPPAIGSRRDSAGEGRGWGRQHTWHWHVTAGSAPPGLRLQRRVLAPPSDVIKAAAAEPGGARPPPPTPVLEAAPEQECRPRERSLTCAVLVHIPPPPHSCRAGTRSGSAGSSAGSRPSDTSRRRHRRSVIRYLLSFILLVIKVKPSVIQVISFFVLMRLLVSAD